MANLNNLSDLSGQSIGQFEVIRQTAHRKYQTRCTKCGTIAEGVKHADLVGPHLRCFNTGCDRPKKMTLLDFQNEQEAQEAAEREERERPLKEAEAAMTKSLRALHKVTKERITTGREDEETWKQIVDTVGTTMSVAEADRRNGEIVHEYKRLHPEYYPTEANSRELTGYFKRNGIQILSLSTLEKAVERLREYGLLEERPQPEPEPELLEEPIAPTPSPDDDGSEEGWDEATGEKVRMSAYRIRKMSGEEYLKFKRIPFSQLVRPVHPVR